MRRGYWGFRRLVGFCHFLPSSGGVRHAPLASNLQVVGISQAHSLEPQHKVQITTGEQEVTLRSGPYSKLASSRLSHHVSAATQPQAKTVLGMLIPSLPVLPCCVLCFLTLVVIAMRSQESPSSLLREDGNPGNVHLAWPPVFREAWNHPLRQTWPSEELLL